MPTVSIGTMDKRINSTKQTFSSAFSADCKLKEPCGMESPVFIVQGLSKGSFYNYASFEGRYFWVDDIVYLTNDIQEVHCHLDPLATYKDDIKNTFALVQYGDSSHWNKWVDDVRFNPEQEISSLFHQQWCTAFVGNESGSIVMRIFDAGATHGISNIAMTYASFSSMLEDLNTELSGKTVEQIAAKIGGWGAWSDNILGCIWVPFDLGPYSSGTFYLGGIPITTSYRNVSPIVYDHQPYVASIDWSWADNYPYLKNSRFCSYQIVTPFGYCELPIEHIVNQSNLYINAEVVKTTGDVLFTIWEKGAGDGTLLASFAGNVSVDMMGQFANNNITPSVIQGMKTGAKLGIGAATLGMSLGAGQIAMTMSNQQMSAADKFGDAGQYASAAINQSSTRANVATQTMNAGYGLATCTMNTTDTSAPSGTFSAGIVSLWVTSDFGKCRLVRKVFAPVDYQQYKNFCDMYGYPCNGYWSLSTFSGYVKCSGAIVEAEGASPASLSTLNSMVNSGIYIE